MLAEFAVRRDKHGVDWCRKKFVGPIRHKLDIVALPAAAIFSTGTVTLQDGLVEAREMMALHCRICGGCELKDRRAR